MRSDGSAIANLTTETEREFNVTFDPTRIALSLGVANANLVSNVTVAEGVNITSGKTANIVADGTSETEVESKAGSYFDGRAGLSFGLGFSDADIKTEVNGNVTANQNPGSIVKWEFDPTAPGVLDTDNNRINLATAFGLTLAPGEQPHALKTGDKVSYSNRRGTSIGGIGLGQLQGGLVDGADYYIIVDPNAPQFVYLAETRDKALAAETKLLNGQSLSFNAGAGDAIALNAVGGLNVKSFNPATDVDEEGNITVENPPFSGSGENFSVFGSTFEYGQAVKYSSGDGNAIGGARRRQDLLRDHLHQ